jgi:L-asparaginase
MKALFKTLLAGTLGVTACGGHTSTMAPGATTPSTEPQWEATTAQTMPPDAAAIAAGAQTAAKTAPESKPPAKTPEKAPTKKVVILATGGTIAGAGSAGSYGYKSGEFKVEDLIKAVPNLDKLALLTGEQVANIGSQDMNDAVWIKLADRINELLDSRNVDGIVVTHGTDTLEETGYFLNLVVKSNKPVVLVGSMRPATAVSPDGPGNLYNGVAVAASKDAAGRGVLIVLNDKIQGARDTTKMNTTNVETFDSPNRGPVGFVNSGKISWLQRMNKKNTTGSEFSVDAGTKLPRVDIIYAHSNMDATLIDNAIRDGAAGIVVAGVGDGNMSKGAIEALARAAKSGVAVVRSSRVPTGLVLRNNEINDDEEGFIASGELNPPKSRVLLQLALMKSHEPAQIQRMFNEY